MKKKLITILLLFLTGTFAIKSQIVPNVGINTLTPDPSAGLDINFNNKGLLIPRVALQSNTDVNTIPSPATALLVYNTNPLMTNGDVGFYFWNGTQWQTAVGLAGPQGVPGITGPQGPTGATGPQGPTGVGYTLTGAQFNPNGTLTLITDQGNVSSTNGVWLTNGNVGTNSGVNFAGTTDNNSLVFRTNNINRMSIQANGDIFVAGSKPLELRRYNCNNCDDPNRNTNINGTDWVAVIAGFYPTNNTNTDTRSTRSRMYLNTITNTWWFKGDLQNPSNETWDIDVLFLKRQLVLDERPTTAIGGGNPF